ncbi:hypothetical protein B0H16DRAFT_1589573 [Mycena metata]|uniref:Uncharacterized protein n=1 Tax=Mycena metata TaxID=1033252 RepID=A0AAD7MQR7_9AGAR|nr:hypothetical protein B0H16DRAFT_1635925 [Mycena metata]KAJ7727882.1 hypothetical protein B0H16DRAFT_1589573 [Mycena metata]
MPDCACQDEWLSPKTKFVLSTTAAVAPDLILATDDLAETHGHAGGTYLAQYMPAGVLPRGKKAAPEWVAGFAMLFGVIKGIFDAGRIPTAEELEKTLDLPENAKHAKLWKAYAKKDADCEMVLEALVRGAKYDLEEGDFQDAWGEELDALPSCDDHDFDWNLVEDVLVG